MTGVERSLARVDRATSAAHVFLALATAWVGPRRGWPDVVTIGCAATLVIAALALWPWWARRSAA